MDSGLRDGATMSEVGKHIRALVHELNNPLAVMMGFTQLVLLDGRCEGRMRADLEKAYSEMKRAAGVVEKLYACALSLERGSGSGRSGPQEPPGDERGPQDESR
ncbi:MAG: hypothetical protein HXY20_01360 [Acidobacteria bacterium]|nr:hypothetical protein [Acidobacteriota bacterium]